MNEKLKTIYLGGGCFWCTEAVFQRIRGIIKVTSGYSGGNKLNPTYEEVSSGSTGHAEVIEVIYDESIVSLQTILDIFFEIHDPTSLNRQGNDIGSQYRSIILVTNPDQLALVFKNIQNINDSGRYNSPVVTEVKKFESFYPAEGYHQNYYNENKNYPYCQIIISPKLDKIYEEFSSLIDYSK